MPHRIRKQRREYNRQYRLRTIEKRKQYEREYRRTHMAEILERNRLYKERNPDKARKWSQRAYKKWWAKLTPERKAEFAARAKKYRHAHPEIYRQAAKKGRRTKVLEYWCRQLVKAAVELGKLLPIGTAGTIAKPKNCSDCGQEQKLFGHHADYTKPLEVIWLCHGCHVKAHNGSFHNSLVS